jgi:hypothetical protein
MLHRYPIQRSKNTPLPKSLRKNNQRLRKYGFIEYAQGKPLALEYRYRNTLFQGYRCAVYMVNCLSG